jgi:hypothetical protein
MPQSFVSRISEYPIAITYRKGLNIMGTAKKYQHQGTATLQVKEGTRIADELNALVSVGWHFYRHQGQ